MVSITEEMAKWLKSNGHKPSHITQSAINIAMGNPDPLYDVMLKATIKKLKEDGAC